MAATPGGFLAVPTLICAVWLLHASQRDLQNALVIAGLPPFRIHGSRQLKCERKNRTGRQCDGNSFLSLPSQISFALDGQSVVFPR